MRDVVSVPGASGRGSLHQNFVYGSAKIEASCLGLAGCFAKSDQLCKGASEHGRRCACRCAGIGEGHALVRSEALLAGRLRALAHSLSDANLSGTPHL